MFYAAVLAASMNPEVSWEYQMFYIDQSAERFAADGEYSYVTGEVITTESDSADNLVRFDKGWSSPEPDGMWTDGNTAVIYFDNIPQKNLSCSIELMNKVHCSSVAIFANDTEIGTFSADELSEGLITAEIPGEAIDEGHLILTFDIENPTVIGEQDNRHLGIKCRSIVLNEKDS